jgi:hypothetical protein
MKGRSGNSRNGEKKEAEAMNVGVLNDALMYLSTVYPESRIRIGKPKPTVR